MTNNLFIQTDHTLIPSDLLRAVQDFTGFADTHLQYWVKLGGQDGLCTYQQAFDYLVSDLRDHGLPVRYANFQSFKVQKTKNNKI